MRSRRMRARPLGVLVLALLPGLFTGAAFGQAEGDLPVAPVAATAEPYVPQGLAQGTLQFAGSRTMGQLASVWADGFRHLHPEFKAQFDFQGSETAFANLAASRSAIGLVSRSLTDADREAFHQAHPDCKLVEVDVAVTAIAVLVHPDNPLRGLSVPQLRTLFAESDQAAQLQWSSVGLRGDWATTLVSRVIPDEKSGTRGQFVANVLGASGRLAPSIAHSWHQQVIADVAAQRGGIGFVSWTNARAGNVRTVPIARDHGGQYVTLSADTIANGTYPLIRPLSLVVVIKEGQVADALVAEFLRYVLSRNGQEDVIKDGFQPLGRTALLEQIDQLGWNRLK